MRNRHLTTITAAAAVLLLATACSREEAPEPMADAAEPAPATMEATMPRTASPEGARLFFITPADGDTVSSPVMIEFGLEGMDVVMAGDASPNSGHHHLLVDTGLPDLSRPIPADANHIHFGDGSTSTELELAPGQHSLQLLLGDALHIPHAPPVTSDPITITVE